MAKHMAAKKNNIVRNASVAAVASAALVGSIAPANAFAAAPVASSTTTSTSPVLSSYDYNGYTSSNSSVANTGLATQSTPKGGDNKPGGLTGDRQTVIDAAYDGIGGSYVWGGKSYKAWDCSGFVSYVYAKAGINLTAYTYTMATELKPTSNPQPGDIVFTNGYAHVGIYVGDGKMISALNPSQGTQITAVDGGGFMPVDGYYTAF